MAIFPDTPPRGGILAPAAPHRQPGELTVDALAAEAVWHAWLTDGYLSELEDRIVALEEAVCSRRARRRLARTIRASVAPYAWAGPSFYARRIEDVATERTADGAR